VAQSDCTMEAISGSTADQEPPTLSARLPSLIAAQAAAMDWHCSVKAFAKNATKSSESSTRTFPIVSRKSSAALKAV